MLDTLRAVGALAVLTTHTAFQAGDYTRNGVWGTLLARLDVGVAIFFVLSGFLLVPPVPGRAGAPTCRPRRGPLLRGSAPLRISRSTPSTVVLALVLIRGQRRPSAAVDWV